MEHFLFYSVIILIGFQIVNFFLFILLQGCKQAIRKQNHMRSHNRNHKVIQNPIHIGGINYILHVMVR